MWNKQQSTQKDKHYKDQEVKKPTKRRLKERMLIIRLTSTIYEDFMWE